MAFAEEPGEQAVEQEHLAGSCDDGFVNGNVGGCCPGIVEMVW